MATERVPQPLIDYTGEMDDLLLLGSLVDIHVQYKLKSPWELRGGGKRVYRAGKMASICPG